MMGRWEQVKGEEALLPSTSISSSYKEIPFLFLFFGNKYNASSDWKAAASEEQLESLAVGPKRLKPLSNLPIIPPVDLRAGPN